MGLIFMLFAFLLFVGPPRRPTIKHVLIRNYIHHLLDRICYFCVFLRYRTRLQNDGIKSFVMEEATVIQVAAVRVHDASRGSPSGGMLRISEMCQGGSDGCGLGAPMIVMICVYFCFNIIFC